MVAGASSESVLLAVSALCPAGSKIAVEQPTSSRLLRILSLLKVEAVGVPWDQQGPDLQALKAALDQQVAAFIYQPRTHLPLGRTVSADRVHAMSQLLRNYPEITVIEDDPLGPLADVNPVSIGKWIPQQTTLVRSYCKAFGLDLRSSIIGGSAKHIAAIRIKRSEGIGIISRILQGALHFLLTDVASQNRMQEVRERYAQGRSALQQELIKKGVAFNADQNGLLLWLPVDNEARVVSALAAKNILVSEGSRHFIQADQPHIAVNIAVLPSEEAQIEFIAENIAMVLLNKRNDMFD
ncbi:PREDICTED: putative transcriptional regulatory protein PtsJ [Rhagoletis zephyria]|uniref:putative transcriptional regulatory protein PtsJ n=1 Tax=Rhagoletis zephyria TaxID=28612 RepID=UPI00081165DE|nr:PREDICTED: putative transcriptional regulatory protein PtsJ [Rhagoletis zephyria]